MGFTADETEVVSESLPQKLNENEKLAASLLRSVSPTIRTELVKEFPELGKLL